MEAILHGNKYHFISCDLKPDSENVMRSHHPACLHLNPNDSQVHLPLPFPSPSHHLLASLHAYCRWIASRLQITITFRVGPLLYLAVTTGLQCEQNPTFVNVLSLNDSWCDKSRMTNVHCSPCHCRIIESHNVSIIKAPSPNLSFSTSFVRTHRHKHTQTHTQRLMSALHAFCVSALRARGL